MKYQKSILKITFVCFTSLLLYTCGNNDRSEASSKTNSVVNKIKTGNNLVKGARDLAAESEALKKLTPIPVETLKVFFPETIYSLPKTNSNAIDMAGASTAFATYGQNTSKQINIQLIDGAGDKGSAATGVYRAIKYDKTNREEYGDYTKIKDYEGTMVKEHFDKSQNRYTLEFFYNERFAVKLKVTGFEQKNVWSIFKEFQLDKLSN